MNATARALLLRKVRTELFDVSVEGRAHFQRDEGPISCRSGCSFCCYSKVIVDMAQGVAIYLYLKAEGRWSTKLEADLAAADEAMTPVSHADWLQKRIPCVFLRSTGFGHGTCGVYPVRPVGCALTLSKTDTPERCAEVHGTAQTFIFLAQRQLLRLWLTYDLLCKVAGAPRPLAMTIPGAVLAAHAFVEGLPPPDLVAVDMVRVTEQGLHVGAVFDELGARAARVGSDADGGTR